MAQRPVRRLRKSTITQLDDSDDPDFDISNQPKLLMKENSISPTFRKASGQKATTPQKRKLANASLDSPSKSSPEKARKKGKKTEVTNKSLHSFFGRATEEQRWRRSNTPEVHAGEDLEDDISDDDFGGSLNLSQGSNRPVESAANPRQNLANRLKQEIPTSSQRFAKPPIPTRTLVAASSTGESDSATPDHKPWADRYGPTNLEELAVHKKKVSDVQNWLREVLVGRDRKKLLVLKGPAGSGKTSTLSLLAAAQGVEVVSWQNPTVQYPGNASMNQQFAEFIDRGGNFGSLSFGDTVEANTSESGTKPRVLLVEEFPATLNRGSNALESFRSVLLQYLTSNDDSRQFGRIAPPSRPPAVIIISETLLSSSTALVDSFTAHRLLGPEISNHPLTTVIEFNPVAATFVQKALDIVVRKEARESKRRRTPGPAVIQKIAEIGDVRSAINSLEFFCTRGDDGGDWSGTVAAKIKKKDATPLTEMEKNTLQLVSQRESTLDMFHATGKIVYNKRDDPRARDPRAEPPPKPPDHLLYLYNNKASQVDVESLLNETGTDIQTFIASLHENYILSCNGDDFVESFDGCANILSESDLLNPETRSLVRTRGSANLGYGAAQGGNSDMLKQDEISFQTSCRGLLFHLPSPVQRALPPGARKQDSFKMFYPGSLRLWKPTEEMHDLIATIASRDLDNSLPDGANLSLRGNNTGVSSWRSRGFGGFSSDSGNSAEPTAAEQSDHGQSIVRAATSKESYVLEVLPYRARIAAARLDLAGLNNKPAINTEIQMLKKITELYGSNNNLSLSSADDADTDPEQEEKQEREAQTNQEGRNVLDNTSTHLARQKTEQSQSQHQSQDRRTSLIQRIQDAHNSISLTTDSGSLRNSSFSSSDPSRRSNSDSNRNNHKPNLVAGPGTGGRAGSVSQHNNTPTADNQTAGMEKLYISDDDIVDD